MPLNALSKLLQHPYFLSLATQIINSSFIDRVVNLVRWSLKSKTRAKSCRPISRRLEISLPFDDTQEYNTIPLLHNFGILAHWIDVLGRGRGVWKWSFVM